MLEGEAIVGKCIPDTSISYCQIQSQQSHTQEFEQVQNWREPIYKLLKHPEGSLFITNKQPARQEGLGRSTTQKGKVDRMVSRVIV